ncbi:hypothetical protein INR79_06085 [Vibrio sp. SCSIO 43132]|uniref:hypothetical protein n=1 Tax=Vibrio sp. SCSIO 43132 TaxID=2779363 RepID=UPI001CA8DB8D|nr:hypothetical protein [Vibrio sp. SCSIO 43132]UAB71459.1 hypothetical protein INR79_06085 [Vibrio sp. SCSIO 43132]
MKITIDSIETLSRDITYNDGLNFGRFVSKEVQVYPYEYVISKFDFIDLMSGSYEKCVDEIMQDDLNYNEVSVFGKMNYSAIDDAFKYPRELAEVIETFFVRELFSKTLDYSSNKKFVLNSTESIEVDIEKIIISGRCFLNK